MAPLASHTSTSIAVLLPLLLLPLYQLQRAPRAEESVQTVLRLDERNIWGVWHVEVCQRDDTLVRAGTARKGRSRCYASPPPGDQWSPLALGAGVLLSVALVLRLSNGVGEETGEETEHGASLQPASIGREKAGIFNMTMSDALHRLLEKEHSPTRPPASVPAGRPPKTPEHNKRNRPAEPDPVYDVQRNQYGALLKDTSVHEARLVRASLEGGAPDSPASPSGGSIVRKYSVTLANRVASKLQRARTHKRLSKGDIELEAEAGKGGELHLSADHMLAESEATMAMAEKELYFLATPPTSPEARRPSAPLRSPSNLGV